jgi:peptide/nickel transport system substrate-binding protein
MIPASLQDIPRINATPGFQVLEEPSVRTIFFGMNQKDDELNNSNVKGKNPLKDVRVRRALWMGIDSDLLTRRIMRGKARMAGIIAAPAIPGYDAALDQRPPHSVEGARKLLREAGYPDGFSVNLSCPNDRYVNDEDICVAVTAMWARIGVNANLVAESSSTYFPKIDRGEADIFMFGYATLPTMDGFSIVTAQLSSRKEGRGQNNFGGYHNVRIEEIAREARTELDETKRLALIKEALKISKEEVAYIPLHQQPVPWAVRTGVEVPQFADEYLRLWYMKIR